MTGDANKTLLRVFRTPECRDESRSPPRARTMTTFFKLDRGYPSGATQTSVQWPPRDAHPARQPSLASPRSPLVPPTRALQPSLRVSVEIHARDAPILKGALPVPGAAAFPEESSSPLSVLPMLFLRVPFSSRPLALRRLPTSPQTRAACAAVAQPHRRVAASAQARRWEPVPSLAPGTRNRK